jgi:hypothetical protein
VSNPYGNDPYGQQPQNPYGQQPQNPYGQQPPNPYGGGPGYPSSAGGQQPKTDGVSVAALVTGILCCGIIPLVLGIVGLSRTKNGQRKGRGFAIAGIVLGVIGIIAGIGIGVAAIISAKDVRSIEDLETGQCINADGLKKTENGSVGIIKEVDCSKAHNGEVIAVKTLSAEEADNYDFGNEQQISQNCGAMLDPQLKAKLLDPMYYLSALTQSKTPDAGDHVVCVITLTNGDDLTEDLL